MSRNHLLDDKLLPIAEWERFQRNHPQVFDDADSEKTISHKFDMIYGAGYSLTGRRGYLDRHVPLIWKLKQLGSSERLSVHIVKYPMRHEFVESACIRLLDLSYEEAHHLAVRAEWQLVTDDGFSWDDYENQWVPFIKFDEVNDGRLPVSELRIPPDLDFTPYANDEPLLAKLQDAASRNFRRGLLQKDRRFSKKEVAYTPDHGSSSECCEACFYQQSETVCRIVSGDITPDGWSRRFLKDLT